MAAPGRVPAAGPVRQVATARQNDGAVSSSLCKFSYRNNRPHSCNLHMSSMLGVHCCACTTTCTSHRLSAPAAIPLRGPPLSRVTKPRSLQGRTDVIPTSPARHRNMLTAIPAAAQCSAASICTPAPVHRTQCLSSPRYPAAALRGLTGGIAA